MKRFAHSSRLATRSTERLRGLLLATALALWVVLALPVAASAATYGPGVPPEFCTGVGGGAGQCQNLKGGVAVDNSNGHVYVLDMGASTGNARIDEYTSAGNFVKAFGNDVVASGQHSNGTGYEICEPSNSTPVDVCQAGSSANVGGAITTGARGLAIDSTTHILYLGGSNFVKYYNGTTGAFLGEFKNNSGLSGGKNAPQAFAQGGGIGIDTSGAQHYIYYAATTSVIDKFKVPVVSGNSVTTQPEYACQITGSTTPSATECHVTASQDGAFTELNLTGQTGQSLAVDSSGNIFIAETVTSTPSRDTVSMFDSTGAWVKAFSITAPVAVAASASGTIFVTGGGTNQGGTSVKELQVSNASQLSSFTLPGTSSLGVAVDAGTLASKGSVYTTEREGEQLRKFVAIPPTVTSLNPGKGPTVGGNTVIITGNALSGATEVKFGTKTAAITENTDTQIKATAPAEAAVTVDIRVITLAGESENTAADNYTYVEAPTVTSLNPGKGPTAGGNTVTVTGTNLQEATFKFGANNATGVTVNGGGTSATMTAPAGVAGTVDVLATTLGGESANTAADNYVYIAPHALTVMKAGTGSGSVTCNGGACAPTYADGTSVTIVATADAGSSFGGFSGPCTGPGPCTITIEADMAVTATFNKDAVVNPPPLPSCIVPKLAGKALGKAKSMLKAANCTLGKVTKPKAKKGKKQGPLVVKSSKPGAGVTLPSGGKVDLKLGPKPKKKKKGNKHHK